MLASFFQILDFAYALRITYEIKPGIFDEKRGNAALLIKNSRFYFISILHRQNQRFEKNWRRYCFSEIA